MLFCESKNAIHERFARTYKNILADINQLKKWIGQENDLISLANLTAQAVKLEKEFHESPSIDDDEQGILWAKNQGNFDQLKEKIINHYLIKNQPDQHSLNQALALIQFGHAYIEEKILNWRRYFFYSRHDPKDLLGRARDKIFSRANQYVIDPINANINYQIEQNRNNDIILRYLTDEQKRLLDHRDEMVDIMNKKADDLATGQKPMSDTSSQEIKDAYDTLGLDTTSPITKKVLRKQYLALLKQWHPDTTQHTDKAEAAEKFNKIMQAYNLLTNES